MCVHVCQRDRKKKQTDKQTDAQSDILTKRRRRNEVITDKKEKFYSNREEKYLRKR